LFSLQLRNRFFFQPKIIPESDAVDKPFISSWWNDTVMYALGTAEEFANGILVWLYLFSLSGELTG
jgi:hypothetical protein